MALNSESITWQTGDLRRVSRFLALGSVSPAKQGNWTESSHFLHVPMCERADHRADQAERKDPLSSEWPVLCPPAEAAHVISIIPSTRKMVKSSPVGLLSQ